MRLQWPFAKKSLANPDADLMAIFSGVPAGSNAVGLAKALTVPSVQSAISLLSGSIASFDILVERRADAEWTLDDEHPVAALLSDRPNDWSSSFELIRDLIATALTNDKGALAWVNRVSGEVREIVRYGPEHFTIDYSGDGRLEPTFRINDRPISIGDVIHLRGPFSRSPLSLAAEAIGVAKAMESHAGNLFTRGARPGGVIETPKPLGDSAVGKMLGGWKVAHEGAENAGKTAILWDGATWRQMQLTSVDAQFLELRKFQLLEVARAFRVPPSMLYDFERATWANAEQAAKEWLSSLELWMRPLESAMRRALFSDDERSEYRIRFDRDDFSAVDLTSRATAINSLIASRVLNPNEGRAWLDLAPRDGGEEYANPNTGSNQPTPAPRNTNEPE